MEATDAACAVLTSRWEADPIGSAPVFDELILVETSLPWPSDVSELGSFSAAAGSPSGSRVLAVVPDRDRDPDRRMITSYRRVGGECRFRGTDLMVPTDAVGDVLASLLEGEEPRGPAAPPEFLVCTHGSRDRCCGSMGTRLYAELDRGGHAWRLRRCSHLGGHRFAPTGMSLPDGHLWAQLRAHDVRTVMDREPPATMLGRCRGTPLLAAPFQVIERMTLERFGWQTCNWTVVGAEQLDGRLVLTLNTPEGLVEASAEVEVSRELPVPVCGAGPGAGTKSAPEFAARNAVVRRADASTGASVADVIYNIQNNRGSV